MIGIIAILLFLVLLQDLILNLGLVFNFKDFKYSFHDKDLPVITILVPARNEEKYLPNCLRSIENLNYPKDKIQFIIGNDGSTDATGVIIQEWVAEAKNRTQINISSQSFVNMNGKANALSQMIAKSIGEYLLFTDADCEINTDWAKEMVSSAIGEKAEMVTGITKVIPDNWFSAMQGMDWWLTLGMIKVLADIGKSVTSMGNNMLISKEAYLAIGGFENLPLSVTEDFELAKAINHAGFKAIHHITAENMIETKAEQSLSHLMEQRKRWMTGAFDLPWFLKIMLAMQVLFFPAIIIFVFYNPGFAMAIWICKVLAQSLFIKDLARSTGTIILPFYLISFEFYYLFISWSTIVYYFWPTKVKWKERQYA